jgi:hypothetical protein
MAPEWAFVHKGGTGFGVANLASSSVDAKEFRGNLYAAAKNPCAPLSLELST